MSQRTTKPIYEICATSEIQISLRMQIQISLRADQPAHEIPISLGRSKEG